MYSVEIRHDGLHKYRHIKGNDKYVVDQKARIQMRQWEEMWQKKQEAEKKKRERATAAMEKAQKKALAEQHTLEALEQLEIINNTLLHTLDIDDEIDWDSLKDHSKFTKSKPRSPNAPIYPAEPLKESFEPSFGLFDRIFSSSKQKKIQASEKLYEDAMNKWKNETDELKVKHAKEVEAYGEQLKKWNEKRDIHESMKKEKNDAIEKKKEQYFAGESESIIEYCDMVLSNSVYPDYFPQEFDIDYNPNISVVINL